MKIFGLIAWLFASLVMAKSVVIHVEGMTCPLCTSAVKHSLKKVPGVTRAKVHLNTKQARVFFEGNVSEEALLEAVNHAGYTGAIIDKNVLGAR